MNQFEKIDPKAYDTNYNIYKISPSVLELAQLTLNNKHQFSNKHSFVVDFAKYKDLECCFAELGIDIKPLLADICVYTTYNKIKCVNTKQSHKKDKAVPSCLMVVLKRTNRKGLPTIGDIFFN